MLELMNSHKGNEREIASSVLGTYGDKRALPALIRALGDGNHNVQKETATSLGLLGDRLAIAPLINMLKNKSDYVRAEAIKTVGKIGDSCVLEPLISVLEDDPSLYAQEEAIRALSRITDVNFGRSHKKWRAWWEKSKQENYS